MKFYSIHSGGLKLFYLLGNYTINYHEVGLSWTHEAHEWLFLGPFLSEHHDLAAEWTRLQISFSQDTCPAVPSSALALRNRPTIPHDDFITDM